MATTTAPKKATAQETSDAIAYALKTKGVTWRLIATVHLGAGWEGANMDGGRALRAVNRAKRAGVDPAKVVIPATLTKALAAAAKPAKATPAKAAEAPAKKVRAPRKAKVAEAPTVTVSEEFVAALEDAQA